MPRRSPKKPFILAIAAIDYLFVGLLAWAMRDLSLLYGETAGPLIRHTLHIG